ncbi:MAG: hypothetical protein KGI06_04415 [Candidatus Micrarchaeota archaeon]|nr:hypothetical protein [Candidatus Micrarchaeota archaeon]
MGDEKGIWEAKERVEAKAVRRNPLLDRNAIVMVSINNTKPRCKAYGAMTVRR